MCPKCNGTLDAEGKCPICIAKEEEERKRLLGGEKKVLNRFKDEAEALTALQGLERRLTEFGEDNKFLQEELERRDKELTNLRSGRPVVSTTPSEDPFAPTEEELSLLKKDAGKGLASFGRRVFQHAVTATGRQISEMDNAKTYEEGLKASFYGANKDLIGKELLVGAVTGRVMAENPRVPPHLLLGRIAERTRVELGKLGGKPASATGTISEGGETRTTLPAEKTPSQKEMEKSIKFTETGRL